MKTQLDPRLGLVDERLRATRSLQSLLFGAFDREIHVPAAVVNLVYGPHATLAEDPLDPVQIEQQVAFLPYSLNLILSGEGSAHELLPHAVRAQGYIRPLGLELASAFDAAAGLVARGGLSDESCLRGRSYLGRGRQGVGSCFQILLASALGT